MFVLPMVKSNIVLGIQWLKTLDPITIDYAELAIELKVKRTTIKWIGNNWLDESPLSGGEFKCLIYESEEAFSILSPWIVAMVSRRVEQYLT